MSPTPLNADLAHFIASVDLATFDDQVFNQLALRLFEYQHHHNAVYRRYCRQSGSASTQISDWQEIPAVTTSAFKHVALTCFPPGQAVAVFHTSGTTQQFSGKHYFHTLDFYRQAMLRSFRAYCLPDRQRMRMLLLGPTAEHFPHSSLGYMLATVHDCCGAEGNASFVTAEAIDVDGFRRALEFAIAENEPVFILGTAFNLLKCLDDFAAQKIQLPLPVGSRILDTGGYKGRSREVSRAEFQEMLCRCFGVPENFLLNEYGMTELSSQFYESRIPGAPLHDDRPFVKFLPPWVRVVAVDPDSLRLLPTGETGMLRVFDLANVDSVMAIQTEDLGRAWHDRLELEGRASGAELRGCSLLTENIRSLPDQ